MIRDHHGFVAQGIQTAGHEIRDRFGERVAVAGDFDD
jgi:hypothetical protein